MVVNRQAQSLLNLRYHKKPPPGEAQPIVQCDQN